MESVGMILQKQWKDTWENKAVLIQFVMFPVLVVIMTKLVKIDGMPKNFFVNLFASMYVGMAPLTSLSAVIAEEKEKNTLCVRRGEGHIFRGHGCRDFGIRHDRGGDGGRQQEPDGSGFGRHPGNAGIFASADAFDVP